ncbi:MAG: NAD(P)-dependent alcohol dehydrogenase [Candidatus Lokiarchaeota archaeon]|nr:NAD(P)-dependent alcohol dehydrogenase [Candidatus Lokiarchaeota archaeon]
MKAIVCTKYGPPEILHLKEVDKPSPKDNEVLIKIYAATVTMGDCEIRSLKFSGLLKFLMRLGIGFRGPRKRFSILGQELAGRIESIGKDVKHFKKDDQVFATTGFHFGAYAEYICLSEKETIVIKPKNITYEEAAVVPVGGLEALHFLKKADIQIGQTILIRGASGSIGTYAIQLAKYYGAEVTGVGNSKSLEMMKSIGADKVIDYTKEDFTKSGETYDIIFDIIGKSTFSNYIGSLNKNGIYLLANPKISLINREKRTAKRSDKRYISGNMDTTKERIEQLNFLKELIEARKLKSVIDRRYPLEQTAEAHKYVEKGEKTGNIVITVVHI